MSVSHATGGLGWAMAGTNPSVAGSRIESVRCMVSGRIVYRFRDEAAITSPSMLMLAYWDSA